MTMPPWATSGNTPSGANLAEVITTITVTKYDTAGTFTWDQPDGLKYVVFEGWGGGGGGGGSLDVDNTSDRSSMGSGGGAGGHVRKLIAAADLGSSETVTVGAAGAGGVKAAGTDGGTTSFGAHCQATGGKAGSARSVSAAAHYTVTGGLGGAGTGGDVNGTGQPGGHGSSNALLGHSGAGGSTSEGGGGPMRSNSATGQTSNGQAGTGYGSGGGGALNNRNTSGGTGGAAGAGLAIVTEYC